MEATLVMPRIKASNNIPTLNGTARKSNPKRANIICPIKTRRLRGRKLNRLGTHLNNAVPMELMMKINVK